jgi:hypothetical protein
MVLESVSCAEEDLLYTDDVTGELHQQPRHLSRWDRHEEFSQTYHTLSFWVALRCTPRTGNLCLPFYVVLPKN